MNKQAGMALITVMIMTTVMLSILATIFYRHGVDVTLASRILHSERATLLAMSGESLAKKVLSDDDNDWDDLSEDWARTLPLLPVEGCLLRSKLHDLQARYNINNLQKYSEDNVNQAQQSNESSDYKILSQITHDFWEKQQLFALIDWLDEDDNSLPGGAEAHDYLLKKPPYRSANTSLVELKELNLIEGFTLENIEPLQDILITLPDYTSLNVNTAPLVLLMALSEFISEDLAEHLIKLRADVPWETTNEFYRTLANELNLKDADEAEKKIKGSLELSGLTFEPISVASRYFLLAQRIQCGHEVTQLHSVLKRTARRATIVIQRSLQFLPNI